MKKYPLTVFLFYLFLLTLSFGKVYCQVDLERGLTGYWQLDDSMLDSSDNAYNGFFSGGVTFGPDRFGREKSAIVFDGTSGYASISVNDKIYQNEFTISGWFKSSSDKEQNIIGKMSRLTSSANEELQVFLNKADAQGLGFAIVPEGTDCSLGRKSAESLVFVAKPYCKERWYFFVVTFDGKFQKTYIDGKLSGIKSVNFSRPVGCSQNILFGAGNQSKPDFLNGSLDEIRIYNRVVNEEEIQALFGFNNNPLYDFSYLPNSCNPLEVRFIYNGPGDRINWLIENQLEKQGRIINHLFAASNDYNVALIVGYNNCTLRDTLSKTVGLRFQVQNLIINNDSSICSGSSFQLNSSVETGFCWQPHPFIVSSTARNAIVKPITDTFFVATRITNGPNLVRNGDFSAGNTGFFTTYKLALNNTTEGEYLISPFPRNWNGALSNCTQPNGQAGNMMLVNGVPERNKVVWQQEIEIEPNRTYAFSVDIAALFPVNPSVLQFAINGIVIGDSIIADANTCRWRNFYTIWNSGKTKSARISIINRNIEIQGNDFGIDNITFSEIIYATDTVKVKVVKGTLEVIKDTAICRNGSVKLNAKNVSRVKWTPATGLDKSDIAQPTATISETITYTASAILSDGCEAEGKVTITGLELPDGKVSPSVINLCKSDSITVSASGGVFYSWQGADFSNANTSITRAFVRTNNPIYVTIKGSNDCSITDSIKVNILQSANFSLKPLNPSICHGDSISFEATGGTSYKWIMGNKVVDSLSGKLVIKPQRSDTLSVSINNSTCNESITLRTGVKVNALPDVHVTSSNNFDCYTKETQLEAIGGKSYQWEPNASISALNISNPVAVSGKEELFKVIVTDSNGCKKLDSVKVQFLFNPSLILSGSGTYCKNSEIPLLATGAVVYQWTPAAPLNNALIANPKANITQKEIFRVRGLTSNGCEVLDSLEVLVFPEKQVGVLQKTINVCGDSTIGLNAFGGVSYKWQPASLFSNPGISNPLVKISQPLTLNVLITDENGCSYADSVFIDWQSKPIFDFQLSPNVVCQGDSIKLSPRGGDQFRWLVVPPPIPLLNSNSFAISPKVSGKVGVYIINDFCRDSVYFEKSFQVEEIPSIKIEKSGDWDCTSSIVTLNATGGDSYIWENIQGISDRFTANPQVKNDTTTTFRVQGFSGNGCKSDASITVKFINNANLNNFLIPTAFTPNGDGLNDCIGLSRNTISITNLIFEVYNRYGQLVFSGNQFNKCWDGTTKGQRQPSGNYIYKMRALTACGLVEQKGSFLLIR